jgi:hypothetical protein
MFNYGFFFGILSKKKECIKFSIYFELFFIGIFLLFNSNRLFPFLFNIKSMIWFLIVIFFCVEFIFFFEKEKIKKIKKDKVLFHTLKQKLYNILDIFLIVSFLGQVYLIKEFLKEYASFIYKCMIYFGIGSGIIFIFFVLLYIWLKINSLKYKKYVVVEKRKKK